jgi:putative ABC transport system permease protein
VNALIVQLAARNALRNTRRSALTALTVFLGTALLTIALSWVLGVRQGISVEAARASGHVRVLTETFAARERLQPLSANIPDSAPVEAALRLVPGVVGVYPRIQVGVLASVEGQELGEVGALVVGAPLAYFEEVMELRPRLSRGSWFDAGPDAEGQALLGAAIAADMGVGPGDEAIFLGQTQDGSISPIKVRVQGIVDTGNGQFDKRVFLPLDRARWLVDVEAGALDVAVMTADLDAAAAVEVAIREQLPALAAAAGSGPLTTQRWDSREPFASMLVISGFVLKVVSAVIVFIAGLGVLNTMLMSVLERQGEIGVLRALGLRARGVVALFVIEALAIALVGGLLGVGVGSAASLAMERSGVDLGSAADDVPDTLPVNRVMYPDWTPDIALLAVGLGMAMALVGSASPALRASRIEPVEAMRSRR